MIVSWRAVETLRPRSGAARESLSTAVGVAAAGAGAGLALSVVAVGFCANATVASNADPTRPAVIYFANIWVLPNKKLSGENLPRRPPFQLPQRIFEVATGDDWRVRGSDGAIKCARQIVCGIAARRDFQGAIRTRPSPAVSRNTDAAPLPASDRPSRNPCRRGTTARAGVRRRRGRVRRPRISGCS